MELVVFPHVKNCEVSEILPYLQANMFACCSFIYTSRKPDTPGSETEDSITTTASGMSIMFASAPLGNTERPRRMLHAHGLHYK